MTPRFPTLLRWQMLRNLRRHPLLAILNVGSVALGVAVFIAIRIANDSANASFAASIDLVAGRAHLEVRGDIAETIWPGLAREPGIRASTPVVEGVVTLPDLPGEYLQITGVDLFTSEPFRTFEIGADRERVSAEEWLNTPGGVALTQAFAQQHRIAVGDSLRVLANGVSRELRILATIDAANSPAASQPRFAVMDIGWAQELLGQQGRLSSIQVLLEEPAKLPAVASALSARLPPDLQVEPPRQRSFQVQQMLAGFQLNLSALSMVSLLVGTFLIYNTVSASVVRRRTEIGILRALGATSLEMRSLFLCEASLLGLLGIVLGSAAGLLLAQTLIGAVGKTISSLYVLVNVQRQFLAPAQFLLAALVGFAAVLAGAWMPARDATKVNPVAALTPGAFTEAQPRSFAAHPVFALALLAASAGASWIALSTTARPLAFVAAFLVLCAFAVVAPSVTTIAGRAAEALSRGNAIARVGAANLGHAVRRNAVTVAALGTAVAMTVGLTIMIYSFRESVNSWIGRGVAADLFIAPSSNEVVGLGATIPQEAIAWLKARPEILAVDTFRELRINVQPKAGPRQSALLAVVDGAYRQNMQFFGGGAERKMARVFAGEVVAVTESLSRKFRVSEGEHVQLVTPGGLQEFAVAGVYRDYSRDEGGVLIGRTAFDRHWRDPRVQSLAIYLRPASDTALLADAFRTQFSRAGEFAVYSNRELRRRILSIFDETFAVTYVLRTVAILVAVTGIFLSMTTLVTERRRELGVLRAVGASRTQLARMLIAEAAMLGTIASLLGLASGVLLAMILTWVVNPAFFGWTIDLRLPWTALISTPAWIAAASALAAWYPALAASKMSIAEAVRSE